MAERMTGIRLRNSRAARGGLAEYGRRTPEFMISQYRRYAQAMLEEAQAILAADDGDFHVTTYTGVHVQRNREVLQEGAPPMPKLEASSASAVSDAVRVEGVA